MLINRGPLIGGLVPEKAELFGGLQNLSFSVELKILDHFQTLIVKQTTTYITT